MNKEQLISQADSNVLKFKRKAPTVLADMTPAEKKVFSILESSMTNVEEMSSLFDVSQQTIRNIKLLKTKRAKGVAKGMKSVGLKPIIWDAANRFTAEEVVQIRASSETSGKLAKTYDCAPSTIRMVRTGKTYV